jgi:hypothetical protein
MVIELFLYREMNTPGGQKHKEIMMKETSEAILENIDGYIITQAKKLMCWHLVAKKELDNLEVDELTQRVRIKFWKALEKGQVFRPYSYVRSIIYSEFIDMKRQQKQMFPLPNDEEEEAYCLKHQEDPADEIIQRMEAHTLLRYVIQMIIDLPPRQRKAMICSLWEQVDDLAQLRTVLTTYGFDGEEMETPLERTGRRTLLASLSVARRKLAQSLSEHREAETQTWLGPCEGRKLTVECL